MKTIDISGMGGGYEAGCQLMLLRGLNYLKEHPDFDFGEYKSYRNVYGICEGSDRTKELDEIITTGVKPSGAMHQFVISHLAYIHKYGHDAWIAEAEKRDNSRVHELPTEDELEKEVLISQIEWQLKLDRGYNPMAELFRNVPMEDVITVDPNDPDSIRKAAEEIARRMKSG